MAETINMGLTTWEPGDYFNSAQLKSNWELVDDHDHTDGKGKPILEDALGAGSVTNTKIADGAVTGPKIEDESITQYKLATDLSSALDDAKNALNDVTVFGSNSLSHITGDYTTLSIKSGVIYDTHIATGAAIDPSKINIFAYGGTQISATDRIITTASNSTSGDVTGVFGNYSIGVGAVTEGKIYNGSVTEGKIGPLAVTEGKIGTGSVTENKIGTGAVTANKIGTGAVTAGKIASAAWTTWTPTIVNWTKGNATIVGTYQRIQNTVFCKCLITTGTTSAAVAGNGIITFSLPFTPVITSGDQIGTCTLYNTWVSQYWNAYCVAGSTGVMYIRGTGSYGTMSTGTSGVFRGNTYPWSETGSSTSGVLPQVSYPWGDGSGNKLSFSLCYEVA